MRSARTAVVLDAAVVVFDLDGVLADSSQAVLRHWSAFAGRHGLDVDEVLATSHGRRSEDVIRSSLTHPDRLVAECAWFEDLEAMDVEDVSPLPGAQELVHSLAPSRYAVVTSGARRVAVARLEAAGLPVPAVLICGDGVSSGKPDPEGYRRAFEALSVAPSHGVVLEDAPAGIAAALAAGAVTVGVATTHPPSQIGFADYVVQDLRDVTVLGGCGDAAMKLRVISLRR